MSDFDSVFSAALRLSDGDRLRVIDALWDSVPPNLEAPFSDERTLEIEKRVAEIKAGTAQTIPWPQIRAEVLERLRHCL